MFYFLDLQEARPNDIVTLLDSPHSTIAPFVQDMVVKDLKGHHVWQATMLSLLKVLRSVTSLRVMGFNFGVVGTREVIANGISSLHLKELMLLDCQFASFEQFTSCCSSPLLEELLLLRLSIPPFGSVMPSTPPHSLTSVTIIQHVSSSEHIYQWLSSGTHIPAVERLSAHCATREDSVAIANYIQFLGPSLKHLEIDFHAFPKPARLLDTFSRHAKLCSNSYLCFIKLEFGRGEAKADFHIEAESFVRILSQITSSQIEEVKVGPDHLYEQGLVTLIDWITVESILARPNYKRLQNLVIFGAENDRLEEMYAWINERAPALKERVVISEY